MIYCRLLKKQTDNAVYSFGAYFHNMTGEMVFYTHEPWIEVVKQPDDQCVYKSEIGKLFAKYRVLLQAGQFPEKMTFVSW